MLYQEEQEIGFWKDLYNSMGLEKFLYLRHGDLIGKTAYFPEVFDEQGQGLDYGCGMISMFEFSSIVNQMRACDPLLPEYREITGPVKSSRMVYSNNVDVIEPETFDFIVCVNVIDHTPDPQTIIDDLLKVLKPGGKLYFEVNFDPELFAPHHTLWTMDTVRQYFSADGPFELVREATHVNPKFVEQTVYEAVYIKK